MRNPTNDQRVDQRMEQVFSPLIVDMANSFDAHDHVADQLDQLAADLRDHD